MVLSSRLYALGWPVAACGLALAGAAEAKPVRPAFIPVGAPAGAPLGFVEMCRTDDRFCSGTPATADATLATSALAASAVPPDRIVHRSTLGFPALAAVTAALDATMVVAPVAVVATALSLPATPTAPTVGTATPCGPPSSGVGYTDVPFGPIAGLFLPARSAIVSYTLTLPAFAPAAVPCLSPVPVLAEAPPAAVPAPVAIVAAVAATPPAMPDAVAAKLLKRVNRFVNGRVRQETDMQMYGEPELWRRSGVGRGAVGDCEDIAIEKRIELLAEGFPPDHLYFAVVYSREAGLHTVLVARTGEGDLVLDSRSPYIQTWSKTSYSWISVQSTQDPMIWHSVGASSAA